MKTISLLTLTLCIIGVICQFQPNWKVTPPNNAFQMQFTPDRKYLAISNDSHIVIYEAELGKIVQQLDLDKVGLISFRFNSDSSWLAAGFKDSEVRLYHFQEGMWVFSNKTYKNTTLQTSVKSICFTSDSANLVIGLYQDLFVVWNIENDTTLVSDFKNQFVFTVSCSPKNPALFAVGGGTNTVSKFTFYTFDNNNITQFHDIQNLLNESAQSSTFSSNGDHIYIAQKNGLIVKYDTTNFNKQIINITQLSNKSLTKIIVSENQRLIATAFMGKVAIITNSVANDLKAYTAELYNSQVASVALSPQGGHVLYISATGEGQVLGECAVGQYSDNNGQCLNCNPSCAYCDGSQDLCYSCQESYYLDTNTCLACSFACKVCQSATLCTQCVNDQLSVQDGFCKCTDSASYIDESLNCQNCNTTLQFCISCTNATTCLTCQEGLNKIIKDGVCVCDYGFYSDINNVCQPCSAAAGCLECSSLQNCTKCNDIQNWELDTLINLCVCRTHYYQNNSTCQACILGCATCQDSTTCITCSTQQHWQNNGTQCICMSGYYQQDQLCQACMVGCLKCNSSNICDSCNMTAHFYNDNGLCKCLQGYYVGANQCLTCNNSISHCQLCTQDGKTCNQCFGQIKLINNLCVCDKGKWPNIDVCLDCPQGCTECFDNDNCTACEKGYDLDQAVCRKNGIDTLIIVLIIVGVILLAGGIFVVIKCIKKRRSPMAQDDYQEL